MLATRTQQQLRLSLSLILALGIAACRSTSTDPNEPAASVVTQAASAEEISANLKSGFYPLQQGNRWDYHRTFEFQIIPDNAPPSPPEVFLSNIESEIVGTEQLFGRSYVVQKDTETEGPYTFLRWIRFRQDASGLYEADVSIGVPAALTTEGSPGRSNRNTITRAARSLKERMIAAQPVLLDEPYRALLDQHLARRAAILSALSLGSSRNVIAAPPGGALSGEITRLRYPMHRGATWNIRNFPLFASTVEGPEMLDLPIGKRNATRVRITPPGQASVADIFLWYNRCGLLRLTIHIESEASDSTGQPIGRIVSREEQVITGLDLVDRNGCDRP